MYLPFQPGKDDYPKACDPDRPLSPEKGRSHCKENPPEFMRTPPQADMGSHISCFPPERNRNPGTPSEVCRLKKAEVPPHTCGSDLLFPPNLYLEGLRSKLCFLIVLVLQKMKITRNLKGVSKSPWFYKMFDDFYYCVSVPTQERNAR